MLPTVRQLSSGHDSYNAAFNSAGAPADGFTGLGICFLDGRTVGDAYQVRTRRRQQGKSRGGQILFGQEPSFYQISKQEQVLDILRNVTTNPADRVKEFSFKAGGGSYSKLFDGTEKVLSWDNILWINRSVSLP
jgi:hypothetical protein